MFLFLRENHTIWTCADEIAPWVDKDTEQPLGLRLDNLTCVPMYLSSYTEVPDEDLPEDVQKVERSRIYNYTYDPETKEFTPIPPEEPTNPYGLDDMTYQNVKREAVLELAKSVGAVSYADQDVQEVNVMSMTANQPPEIVNTIDTVANSLLQLRPVFTDANALKVPEAYPDWMESIGTTITQDDIDNGRERYRMYSRLYRCVQPHTIQYDWPPDRTPALWVEVSLDEWPQWRQPQGAHDAYNTGDKVTYEGKKWTSDIDANVWKPGEAGWSQVTE